jgi:WD repeat-containing protein 35
LTVYNSIGISIDSKYLDFEPKQVVVAKTNVFCANDKIVFLWQFKMLASVKMSALDGKLYIFILALRRRDVKDRAFHIDDMTTIGHGEVSYLSPELISKK